MNDGKVALLVGLIGAGGVLLGTLLSAATSVFTERQRQRDQVLGEARARRAEMYMRTLTLLEKLAGIGIMARSVIAQYRNGETEFTTAREVSVESANLIGSLMEAEAAVRTFGSEDIADRLVQIAHELVDTTFFFKRMAEGENPDLEDNTSRLTALHKDVVRLIRRDTRADEASPGVKRPLRYHLRHRGRRFNAVVRAFRSDFRGEVRRWWYWDGEKVDSPK